jgi:hypothetical protein
MTYSDSNIRHKKHRNLSYFEVLRTTVEKDAGVRPITIGAICIFAMSLDLMG